MVREQPWWDRHQGRDHLWTFTTDNGFCGFAGGEGAPEARPNDVNASEQPVLASARVWGLGLQGLDTSQPALIVDCRV